MNKELSQLITELFDHKIIKEFSEEDVNRILKQKNIFLFVKKIDGKIVAMLTLYVVNLLSRNLGVIEEVVTLKKYRGQGIATSLIQQAIYKARELKLDCVELCVREDKPEIQKFYKKFGFYDRKNKSFRLKL